MTSSIKSYGFDIICLVYQSRLLGANFTNLHLIIYTLIFYCYYFCLFLPFFRLFFHLSLYPFFMFIFSFSMLIKPASDNSTNLHALHSIVVVATHHRFAYWKAIDPLCRFHSNTHTNQHMCEWAMALEEKLQQNEWVKAHAQHDLKALHTFGCFFLLSIFS